MLVPVIIGHKGKEQKTEKVGVSLMSHNLNMVSSRLKFHLIQSEAVSMTVMERKVVCQVFNGDEPVTAEKELLLNSTDIANLNNRVFEVTLNLNKSVTSSVLQLRVYDVDDRLNPLIKETVKNNTIIEQDFIKNSNDMTLQHKIMDAFIGKVVRKDLAFLVKGGLPVPTYVLEYLLGQYCASDDEEIINEGLEKVKSSYSEQLCSSCGGRISERKDT